MAHPWMGFFYWKIPMTKMLTAQLVADQLYTSGYRPRQLLTRGNAKLAKTEHTLGLSLAPAQTSGYQVCASAVFFRSCAVRPSGPH